MKQFNIVKNQQIVFGHIFPKNAFYGKFTLNWEKTEKIGMKVVKDKNGHTRFNKNGMPIIRNQYKTTKMHNSCVYCVESLQAFKHKDRICLGAYVLFENAKTWQYMHLGGTKFLDELNKFIVKNILEYSHSIGVELIRLHTAIEEPCINGSKITKPHRRHENKFDNVFRMRPDYSGTINEEVRPRMPMVHTNMDKLHPLDERPMVTVKAKNPKLETYVKYTRTVTVKGEGGESYTITEKITDTK